MAFDELSVEANALGGTFDLSGTVELTDKKVWGFTAEEGTIIEKIYGFDNNATDKTPVDKSALLVTSLSAGLMGGVLYRIKNVIITNLKLTSGKLHLLLTVKQD